MTPTERIALIHVGPIAMRPWSDGDSLDLAAPLVWTVDDLFTASECSALVARIEAAGPTEAPITTAMGFVMRPDIRNNTRVMFDDIAMAADLWERSAPHVPARMCGDMLAVGANERFRCYRYEPGQRFARHYDGSFMRDAREESLLTCIVYLNEDFEGGATDFPTMGVTIRPRTGTALYFQHRILHEGCEVTAGRKYAARSDIMYRR